MVLKKYMKLNSRVERLELKITSTSTLININLYKAGKQGLEKKRR